MRYQVQLARGTAAEWTAANPILADGEPGVETDTHKIKIGDGVTAWNSLAYSSGSGGEGGATDLTAIVDTTTVTISSSTGNNAVLTAATATEAGVMSAAQAEKLAGIEVGAGVTPTAATNAEIATASETSTRTISPVQVALGAAKVAKTLKVDRDITERFFGFHQNALGAGETANYPAVQGLTTSVFRTWDAYPYVAWGAVNTADGVYDWSGMDSLMTYLQPKGCDIIYTLGWTPDWVTAGNFATKMATFITAFIARYPTVNYIELWNEPDTTNGHPSIFADLATWRTALVAAAAAVYTAIKAANSSIKVISPSCQDVNGADWLDTNFLSIGGDAYCDIIGFHGYLYNEAPEAIETLISSLNAVVAKYPSLIGKPLYNTEYSWGPRGSTEWGWSDTESRRIAWQTRHLVLSAALGVARQVWYIYPYTSANETAGTAFGGLWNATTATMSNEGIAFREVMSWLIGAHIVEYQVFGDVHTVLLTRQGAPTCLIAWDGNSSSIHTTSWRISPHGYVRQRTVTGAVTTVADGDSVTLSATPVMFETNWSVDLDIVPDGTTRTAMTAAEKTKLSGIADGAAALVTSGGNAGTATTAARSDHVHALTIGNGTATQVSLTTSDRLDIVSGSGSTVAYDDTNNKVTIAADLATSGGDAGTATTIARSDHAHSSYVNPTAATDTEVTTGTGTSIRGYTPAQLKLGAQTFGGAQLVTSGGNAGTATTASRSDHVHAAATTSVAGFMSAADKSKINGMSAAGEYVLVELNPGNTTTTISTMASTTVRNGLGGNAIRTASFVGIDTIDIRLNVATAGATAARLALIYATNPSSPTWTFMDGATAVPADGTAAISSSLDATYSAIDISTTGYKKIAISLPTAFKTAAATGDILLNVMRWGGDGTTSPVVVGFRIVTPGTSSSITPSYAATDEQSIYPYDSEALSVLAWSPAVTRTLAENVVRRDKCRSLPTVYTRGRTVKRLDRDFSTNNLTFDGKRGSSTGTSAGTNNRTKLQNILASLTGPTDLIFPGGYAEISNGVVIPDGVRLISYGKGDSGLINTNQSGSLNETSAILGLGSSRFPQWNAVNNVSYLANGITDTDIVHAGDPCFKVTSTVYAAMNVGDRCVMKDAYQSTSNSYSGKSRRLWPFDIQKKEQVGSDYLLYFDVPPPFDISGTAYSGYTNASSTHWFFKDSSNAYIQGIAFHRFADMALSSTVTGSFGSGFSYDWMTFDFEAHGIYLESGGHPSTTGQARDALYKDCVVVSGKSPIYGNLFVNTKYIDCNMTFGARIMEMSMQSSGNLVDGCNFFWNGDTTYGGEVGSNFPLFGVMEDSSFNEFRNLTVSLGGWDLAGTTNTTGLFRSLGDYNRFQNIRLRGFALSRPFLVEIRDNYSNDTHSKGCSIQNVYIEGTYSGSNASTDNIAEIRGDDHAVRGFELTSASNIAGTTWSISTGYRFHMEDVKLPTYTSLKAAASTVYYAEFERCGKTVTDSGTGTVTSVASNTPDPSRWYQCGFNGA